MEVALPTPAVDVSSVSASERRTLERNIGAFRSELHGRARVLCRPPLDPDDLVQDVLERALRSAAQIREGAKLRAWLFTILTNTFIDRVRQLRSQPPVEPADDALPEAVDERPDWTKLTAEQLLAAVAQLPDDTREVYRLHALDGRDYIWIAAHLDIPKSTVGTRLLRARKQLRELLAKAGRAT
jgi:RNA polymerase sigma-70 factor, ECF subfamily